VTVALHWPIVVPFLTAVASLVAGRRWRVRHAISLTGSVVHFAIVLLLLVGVADRGILVAQMGNWPAPFGITLVADRLSAMLTAITGFVGLCAVVYARSDIPGPLQKGSFHAFLQVLVGAICGAFLAGDLFNLYVWFEVMLMASFALLVLGQTRAQLDGGVKYVAINLVATLLFLSGVGLLYGLTGTLNLADLHLKVAAVGDQGLVLLVSGLFLMAFGIKAALFPMFFWLPAAYHTPPVTVTAVFAGLLTKVGVYALLRLYTLVFVTDTAFTHTLLLVLALMTMVTGVLGAAAQGDVRRILSFHIISQVGYMVLGLALFTPLAIGGAVFYLLHHIVVKANLFFVSGVMKRLGGSFELAHLGGFFRSRRVLTLAFFIPAFSLAGFPPLSGFWAKMALIRASLEVDMPLVAAVAAAVGLMTVYSMTKIWNEAFWKPSAVPVGDPPAESPSPLFWLLAPVVAMALITVALGVWPEPFMGYALMAAEDLTTPERYVRAVLGAGP
jgi:multicomponent Na+:H+ antiporter subunit D